MCQRHHHPPPGSVTGERGEREEDKRRGGRDVPRCCEREGGALALLFTSITGEATQRLGQGRQLLPFGTKQVRVSTGSAP